MRLDFCFLVLFLFVATGLSAATRIVAVVGDELISSQDVGMRLGAILDNKELEENFGIWRDVLNILIEESVIAAKAREEGIVFNAEQLVELNARVEDYIARNPLSDRESVLKQVKTGFLWSRLVEKFVLPEIIVGKKEINDFKEQMKNFHVMHVKFTQVALGDDISDETVNLIKEKAVDLDSLVDLSRQFSFKVTRLDWLSLAQLNPDIRSVMQSLGKGEVSPVMRTSDGINVVLFLEDSTSLSLESMSSKVEFFQLRSKEKRDLYDLKGRKIRCEAAKRHFAPNGKILLSDLVSSKVKDLQEGLRDLLIRSKLGVITAPLQEDENSWVSLLVCKRSTSGVEVDDEYIRKAIFDKKLPLYQKYFLDQIISATPIDIIDNVGAHG